MCTLLRSYKEFMHYKDIYKQPFLQIKIKEIIKISFLTYKILFAIGIIYGLKGLFIYSFKKK